MTIFRELTEYISVVFLQSPIHVYLKWYDIKTEHHVVVKKLKFVEMLYVPCVCTVW
jgi:hypothetical protein